MIRLYDDAGEVESMGGVVYTIKDGTIYYAKQLLRDVREIVQAEKDRLGMPELLPRKRYLGQEEKEACSSV